MTDQPLPARLLRGLLEHLDREADLLSRLQQFSTSLTSGGYSQAVYADRQPELAQLSRDATELSVCRDEMRVALSRIWKCPPSEVRLSRIQLDNDEATDSFQSRRQELLLQAARTTAGIATTQQTLSQWHGLLSSMLAQVLPGAESTERYTASGQRSGPHPVFGVEIRS